MPLSHCREFCLRTNTNWHSLRIAQHRIDSNYFVLFPCHFRISSQANTNVLKCSKHSYWPCESKHIHIASYCTTKFFFFFFLVVGYWFHSVRPSVCPSVRPSRIPCPLCSAFSSGWIHFMYTSYQATSEGVSRAKFLAKF